MLKTTYPLHNESEKILLSRSFKNESGFIGVTRYRDNKWKAEIKHKGVKFYLGIFNTATEAAVARDKKAIELRGENAITNQKLGLLTGEYTVKNIKSVQKIYNQSSKLDKRLMHIANFFIEKLWESRNKQCRFIDLENDFKVTSAPLKCSESEVKEIFQDLETNNLIRFVRQQYTPKLWIVKLDLRNTSNKQIKQQNNNEDLEMQNLENLTPEMLENLAKQAADLAKKRKQEVEEKHNLRTILNPLILQVAQTKGKFEKQLNELLDTHTELENALNALKDALK